jgi:hypothetical protein
MHEISNRSSKLFKPTSREFSMKKTTILTLLIALLSACGSSMATEVAKAEWLSAMSTAVPTSFCQPKQYFRQCFSVSAEECEQVAASSTRTCLEKHKSAIPEILVQPADGTRFGTVVGACAGSTYEITLTSKRISSAKCNDPNNWKQ